MAMSFFRMHIVFLAFTVFFACSQSFAAEKPENAFPGKPAVLVFGLGPRCRYCVQLHQEIDIVKARIGDQVLFRDYLVDQDKVMVHQYRVMLSPTLIFLTEGGKEAYRFQGMMNASQILDRLYSLGFLKTP